MNSSIFIILLILVISIENCSGQFKRANRVWKFEKCDEKNGDECAQRLYLFGYRQLHEKNTARNDREMREYCGETREAEKCVKDWGRKCLGTFEKQTLNLLLSGASQSRRSLCTTKGIQRFFQNRDCFLKTVQDQHDCMDLFKKDMHQVRFVEKKKIASKIRLGCCFTDKWLRCFRKAARKSCNQEGVKFLDWVIEPYVSDAIDLGCRKEWIYGSDKCIQSMKDIPVDIVARNTTAVSKSILLPLYHILTELASDKDIKDLSEIELPD